MFCFRSHESQQSGTLIQMETLVDTSSKRKGRVKRRLPLMRKRAAKAFVAILILCMFCLIYFSFIPNLRNIYPHVVVEVPADDLDLPGPKTPNGFLVWSPQCKIQEFNPLATEVMELFIKQEYETCEKQPPLTSIEQDFENNSVKLVFHQNEIPNYLNFWHKNLHCCYQNIYRSGENETADDKYRFVSS